MTGADHRKFIGNSASVGAAEGCDKGRRTFNNFKSATGSRSIAAFGSFYRKNSVSQTAVDAGPQRFLNCRL
ncbi:MAG: hypothetical protein JWQ69_2364 [Pseudomonas sp.]|nr:hypothetical protein [Pseudomonas sp.]